MTVVRRVRRQSMLVGAVASLMAGLLIAPQSAAASSICESGPLPDGSVVVCFLSGTNVTWTVPDRVSSVQYLVVAGGGGGGADNAGGGGAGGMLTGTASVAPGQELVITVGAGGAAGTGVDPNSTRGANGEDSSLRIKQGGGELVVDLAKGGGGGGAGQIIVTPSVDLHPGLDGGSGGGGAGEAGATANTSGGAGAAGQGNAGGTGVKAGNGGGGGGGGAGAVGAPGAGTSGGDGGAGRESSITGRSQFFAGGGGGAGNFSTDRQGAGGVGGGGAGGRPATAGTPNTGGGGGGGSYNNDPSAPDADGAPGGSGIVVLRYSLDALPSFTINIDANQGTCSVTSVTGVTGTRGNLPGANSCTRTDYEFVGFNTSADGSGTAFAPGAPIQFTRNITLYAIWKKLAPEPFMCTADLYQVSGTGGGVLYVYDPARNTMDLVPAGGGPSRATGANATGFNPVDNFIYGIAPKGATRNLWQFGSNGIYEDLGPIVSESTGEPITTQSLISGDFVDNDILLAIRVPNTIVMINIAPTRLGQPALATEVQAPRNAWAAADIAFTSDRTAGYGISNSTLNIMTLPGTGSPRQLAAVRQSGSYSTKTLLGVPARGTYGATYLDQSNNAYFYNNEQRRIYLITAQELAKTQPTAVPLGTEAAFVLGTTQTLLTPTDGASCAAAPIVTVTLNYRINGGRGTTPDDQIGFANQEVTVAPAVGFERKNFTFRGWNTSADGSGAFYPPGALFDLGESGGVLFAQWAPNEPAPIVPAENVLPPIEKPIEENVPGPDGTGGDVIFTPIKDLPAPPNDPWKPSTVVLVDPDGGNPTPVVQNDSGDWKVNNRTGDVRYVPNPMFSGTAQVVVQLQTESGARFQTKLKARVPSCQRGPSVRATVYFDVLQSTLTAASKRTLNRLVDRANRKGTPVCSSVVGFVQPTPNRSNDISLSTSRATSVADYLQTRGMKNIIRTEGLGRAGQQGAKARRATARIYVAPMPAPLPLNDTTG